MDRLQRIVDKSKRVVFFGGAGVSTASGIPDFRGDNGLFKQDFGELTPEMILSTSYFHLNPAYFFKFYREYMVHPEAKPNGAHQALAAMEAAGKLSAVVTQNIDGLHQAAGSEKVYEMPDGWTVRTLDGSLSAHYENTVAITRDGAKILTEL